MNQSDPQEIWQVEVGGEIYETGFEGMTQWIFEGSLQPGDMVRRGQLRWIEARRVPSLMPFFNAKANGLPPPPVVTTVAQNAEAVGFDAQPQNFQSGAADSEPQTFSEFTNFAHSLERSVRTVSQPSQIKPQVSPFCCLHETDPAFYVCETCGNSFCKLCVKSYGGNVKICPMCGAMCKSFKDLETANRTVLPAYAGAPFGFDDFGRAIAHPFKFTGSLLVGGFLFSLFTLGQSAGSIGSISLMGASLFCFMLANMMTFGVLKNTIENFAQGKLDVNFMPNFEDFSMWDDVVHPFFLSIGAYLVSFGLFFVIVVGGIWWTIVSAKPDVKANGNSYSTIQPLDQSDVNTVKQIDNFKDFANGMNERNKSLDPNSPNFYADTEDDVRQADEMIKQHRKEQFESTFGKSPETVQAEQKAFFANMMQNAFIVILLAIPAFLWGLFYFPAACAVAGYTQSFRATISLSVGLDTIKTLGFDYVKILLMGFLLLLFSGIVGFIIVLVLSAFEMPTFGNLPAKFVSGFVTFYVSAVFSCVLGYAIFKNADKFRISRS